LALGPVVVAAESETKPYPSCERQPSESDVSAAKGAFRAGEVSFNEADYDRAITYWEDAFRRDCTALMLLLNLARAYELQGNLRQAVVALETYQQRNPNAREDIGKRIETLKKKIAALPPPTATGTTEPNQPPPATTPTSAPPTADQPPEGNKPILPLIVAGGGVVVAAIGLVVYLGATGDYDDAEKKCPSKTGCPEEVKNAGNDARNRQRIGAAVGFIGLGAAAAGVVWYVVSKPEPAATTGRPRLSPELAPGFAGLSLSGSF
jgi:hypothetical protein